MSNDNRPNFIFNFNEPVGQVIAHADKVVANFDRDMNMQIVDAEGLKTVQSKTSQKNSVRKSKAGRRKASLFADLGTRREKADYLLLKLGERGLLCHKIDTSKGNAVNKAFKDFYKKFVGAEEPNGSACFRFLKEDCGLEFEVDESSYGEFIRKFIKE